MKTLKQLAQDALNVQNACNLSGVVISFAEVVKDLRKHYPDLSTTDFNRLPINVLWSDKIASLTGSQNMGLIEMSHNYDEVTKLSEAE